MGTMAAIIGAIGGLCAVFGIVTATEVISPPPLGDQFTWTFWFMLSAILFLAAIAMSVGRSNSDD